MDKKTVIYPAKERWINQSNALIRAGQCLTLAEKRIVMLAVGKLDSCQQVPVTDLPSTKITAEEYAREFEVDANTAYEALQEASKSLFKKHLTFYEPAYRRNGKPLKPVMVNMHWVGEAKYHEGEGWVELFWWPRLIPHLLGLKKQFTSYQLKQTTALRSVYSWRLLELLMRFKSTGWAEYTVEDFLVSMDAPLEYAKDFGQVKRSIIEPAVKELINKDGWKIEWQAIKAGRKVKTVRFEFSRTAHPGLSVSPGK